MSHPCGCIKLIFQQNLLITGHVLNLQNLMNVISDQRVHMIDAFTEFFFFHVWIFVAFTISTLNLIPFNWVSMTTALWIFNVFSSCGCNITEVESFIEWDSKEMDLLCLCLCSLLPMAIKNHLVMIKSDSWKTIHLQLIAMHSNYAPPSMKLLATNQW